MSDVSAVSAVPEGYGNAAEYADSRGISRQAISQMLAAGRIPGAVMDRRQWFFDYSAADQARNDTAVRANPADRAPAGPVDLMADDDEEDFGAGAEPPRPAAQPSALNRAATLKNFRQAQLLQMEIDRKGGLLLPKEAVLLAASQATAALGQALDQLAGWSEDLVAVAAAGGKDAVRVWLQDHIRGFRRTLSRELTQAAETWGKGAAGGDS